MAKLNNIFRNMLADQIGLLTTLAVYTGTIPATGETAPTGTKLVEWPATISWNSAATGAVTLTAPVTSSNATASGTAGYGMLTDGSARMYVTVGTTGAEMNFSSLSIASGVPIDLTAATLTMPAT